MFTNAQRCTAIVSLDLLPMFCARCGHASGDDSGVVMIGHTTAVLVGTFVCQKCVNELGHGREASA